MSEPVKPYPNDAQDNKIMGILAYFGLLFLVPIFAAKESPFARFHANQGLLLFIAAICYYFATWIITFIFALFAPGLAIIIGVLLYIASLAFVVLIVIGIINAAKGEMKELPLIGKYRILK